MKRILLIDDDADYAEIMRIRLEKNGYEFEWFNGCEAAIGRLEKSMNFDLIILDVEMPEKNGLATLTHLRNHFKAPKYPQGLEIPVMIATGVQSEKLHDIFKQQKVNDYIKKPFDSNVLIKKIENIINASPSGRKT